MQTDSKIVHLTEDTFEQQVVASEIPVVIDFWAPWCAPCRSIAPVLEQMAERYAGQVKVAKVNVDEQPALAGGFKVRSIPTITAMKGTEVIDVQVGFGGPKALEAMFERLAAVEPQKAVG